MSLWRVVTAGHLYVHFDQKKPRFLLVVPGNERLDAMPNLSWQHDDVLPIYRLGTRWMEQRELLHQWLHARLRNTCGHRLNDRRQRNGQFVSAYSTWVRNESLDGFHGCYDLPLFDIDEADFDLSDQVLVCPVETKRRLETFQPTHQEVIANLIKLGVDYRFEVR